MVRSPGGDEVDVDYEGGVIQLYDPRHGGKNGYFMVERGADLKDLKAALRPIFGSVPTGFMRDNTIYPLRILVDSPELFSESDVSKSTHRQMVALFHPEDCSAESEVEDSEVDDESDALVAFRIMDLDRNGRLHSEEMQGYLRTAYRFLMKYESLMRDVQWTLTPEDLAEATVLDCFNFCEKVLGDELYYSAFFRWFESRDDNHTRDVMVRAIALYESSRNTRQDIEEEEAHAQQKQLAHEHEQEQEALAEAKEEAVRRGFHISLKDAIEEMQIMTGIKDQNVGDVMQLFQSNADAESGLMNQRTFEGCFLYMHALRKGRITKDAMEEQKVQDDLLKFLGQLFSALETSPDSGYVDVWELCVSVSALCDGSAIEKIRAAFELCDTHDEGVISKSELSRYLTTTFNFLYDLSGEAQQLAGRGPHELAQATVDAAFPGGDSDDGGEASISFAAFKKWYITGLGAFDVAEALLEDEDIAMDIKETRHIIGMTAYSADYLTEYFRDVSDEEGLLHKSSYFTAMGRLVRRNMQRMTTQECVLAEDVISKIYDLYDDDDRGYVDFRDIVCGLLLFCGGNPGAKADAAFDLYGGEFADADSVSETEVAECFAALLRLVASCEPADEMDAGAEDLAAEITVRIFSTTATRLTDGEPLSLAREDFRSWFALILGRLSGEITDDEDAEGTAVASTYSDVDYKNDMVGDDLEEEEEEEEDDDDDDGYDDHMASSDSGAGTSEEGSSAFDNIAQEMRLVRARLGLKGVTADDFMETVGEGDRGVLRERAWLYVVRLLVRLGGGDDGEVEKGRVVGSILFKAFEERDVFRGSDAGGLDVTLFVAGMTSLCDGPPEDRVMVAFTCLDHDSDGFISTDSLKTYFTALLLVQVVCSPTTRLIEDLHVETLASAAVDGCLKAIGLAPGGDISLDDFAHIAQQCQGLALSGI